MDGVWSADMFVLLLDERRRVSERTEGSGGRTKVMRLVELFAAGAVRRYEMLEMGALRFCVLEVFRSGEVNALWIILTRLQAKRSQASYPLNLLL